MAVTKQDFLVVDGNLGLHARQEGGGYVGVVCKLGIHQCVERVVHGVLVPPLPLDFVRQPGMIVLQQFPQVDVSEMGGQSPHALGE